MKYYLGGYYLTVLKPKTYGDDKCALIYTCSTCINDSLIDDWSYSWTTNNHMHVDEVKKQYQFSDAQIDQIRNWVDAKHNDNKLGWINVFTDLETAMEYKNKFFSAINDIKVMALYFDENEREYILDAFRAQNIQQGEIGLRLTLLKGIEEIMENDNELALGFDYIGIENGGDFHTFHCNNIGVEMSDIFGLTLNEFHLFDSNINSIQVLDYLNDEKNGFETVPWCIGKVKLVTNK